MVDAELKSVLHRLLVLCVIQKPLPFLPTIFICFGRSGGAM